MKDKFTFNLKNISSKDVKIAGGKGASLGEMLKSNIPVPPGFVVLSYTFEKFIKDLRIGPDIEAILDKVNPAEVHTIEEASEKIQAIILNETIPEDIEKEIMEKFKKLGARFVAVRSSATAEDSGTAAWAGQLESYLNTTEKDLIKNVKKCWASLFTPRAIVYRFEKNLHKQTISVAVVVQKMINSEKAGIAFSVHPVTQDKNQIIIEAGLGLGEAIVSGQITPASYVIEKKPRRIIEKTINNQVKGLYKNPLGGNKWEDISKEKFGKPVLSDKEILKLSELILRIEEHYGFPCDIEWAQEKGEFYIVQSRPITTLTAQNTKKQYKAIFTRPFSLIRMQFETKGEYEGIKRLTSNKYFFKPLFVYNPSKGVTAYYNFSSDEENIKYIFEYLNSNVSKLEIEAKNAKKSYEKIETEIKKERGDIKNIFNNLIKIQAFSSLGNLAGHTKFASKKVTALFKRFRYDYDGLIYKAEKYLLEKAEEKLQEEYKKYVSIITFDELLKNSIPEDIEKRAKGYIFHMDEIEYLENLNSYLDKKDIEIISEKEETVEMLKGSSAFRGIVKGKVKKIFTKADLNKFTGGDILVTPMTIPDFVPIMKKASAFITDEGGITCHAAIIAREMKKPCIIGTKNATKILNDGDFVEVDANKGVVRIIERAKNKENEVKREWVKMWAEENHCYYDLEPVLLNNGPIAEKKVGYGLKEAATFSDGFHGEFYIPLKELERAGIEGYKFFLDKNRMKLFIEEVEKTNKILLENTKKLAEIDLSKMNVIEFNKYAGLYGKSLGAVFSCYTITQPHHVILLEKKLKEFLNKKLKDINEAFSILTVPKSKFSLSGKDNPLLKAYAETVRGENKEIDRSFIYRLSLKEEKIDQSKKQSLIKELKIPQDIINIAEVLGQIAEERLKIRFFWMLGIYYYELILRETKRRATINKEDLRLYSSLEGDLLLELGKKVPENILEQRRIGTIKILKDGKITEINGEEALRFIDKKVIKESKENVGGNVACRGYAKGKVIIFSYRKAEEHSEKIKSMKGGEIIVTEMTRPNIMEACRKAGAIITDEGGITCHAAIIARELKIPCIIGTKIATEIFKDGDLLEVDANKGVIRKIT